MKNTHVSLSMTLQWQDACARHTSTQYFARANLWRDVLPIAMRDAFTEPEESAEADCEITAGESFKPFEQSQIKTINLSQFNTKPRPGLTIKPGLGRFYPRNLVRNEVAISSEDRRPIRVVAMNDKTMDIDLNSPMAPFTVSVSVNIDKLLSPLQEHGGRCNDFVYDMLHNGVGMQSCLSSTTNVDFFSGEPFARLDEREDSVFYDTARIVHHLDATSRQHIEQLYQKYLQPGFKVLDLMSSWVSHLPAIDALDVTGLGMNDEELEQNTVLTQRVLQDLNVKTALPFADQVFDVVVCTVSVEYLVQPIEVFREVARCLKPGGKFIVTFSDRWFPTKAIQLWLELHPFERLSLVTEYFKQAGQYSEIETLSILHYPRPEDDKYSDQLAYSDPVFAVWATVE